MATLTNRNINDTYFGLLKTNDNEVIDGLTRITDGLGCNTSISLNCGNEGACIHGNLTFDTLCDFNFPEAGSSTNEIFIVNNCNITLGNANSTLSDQFTFTGGTSTFRPDTLTVNDKGIITDLSVIDNSVNQFFPEFFCCEGACSSYSGIYHDIQLISGCGSNFNKNIDIFNTNCYISSNAPAASIQAAADLAQSRKYNFVILSGNFFKNSPDSGNVDSYVNVRKWYPGTPDTYSCNYSFLGSRASGKSDSIRSMNQGFYPLHDNRYFNIRSIYSSRQVVDVSIQGFA